MPDDVDARDLDPAVRQDLRGLSKETADLVARHLVLAGRLLDEDPERALRHARAAGAMAGRIGVVREAVGLAAYQAQEWAEALSELRAARRITGQPDHLAVLADCERGMGRPERALALLDDPDVPRLPQAARVELVIVVAGARRDLGQADAAVLLLQGPARATTAARPWAARLWFAYGDALAAAGRDDEAREWLARAASVDDDDETGAAERLLELDGLVIEDLQDDGEDGGDEDGGEVEPPEPVDLQALLSAPPPQRPQRGTAAGAPADGPAPADAPAHDPAPEPAAPPAAAPAAPPAVVGPGTSPGGVPLFSDPAPAADSAAAPAAPRPALHVPFTPPPGPAADADDEDHDEGTGPPP